MKKALLTLLLIALLAWFFGQQAKNAVLSGFIMADIMRYGKPPLLRYLTREPVVKVVHYWGGGREMEADLYVRPDREDSPGIILIHGVNEVGKADPRIRWAAEILCRAGFTVLVPDFLGFKSLRLRPSDIQEIADSFLYLFSRPDLVRPDRLGIAGFSYGAGPVLIAGCDPRLRKKVDFLVSFGGYYDLLNIVQFVTTGHYSYRGESFYRAPNDYTRWIFLHYNLDLLSQGQDRELLQQADVWKRKGKEAELWRGLSEEGKAIYQLLRNKDPERTEELFLQLPPMLQRTIETLSPSRYLQDLKAYLFIVHGVPDDFIPHTESLRLYDALPDKGGAHLVLLSIFSHVRPSLPPPSARNLILIYLPEGAKFYSLVYKLLQRAS